MTLPLIPPAVSAAPISLSRGSGYRWDILVSQGSEIAFSFQWQSPQVLSWRLVTQSSYLAWEAKTRASVDVWASAYGAGLIRGSLVPPFPGWWVVLLDYPPAATTPSPPSLEWLHLPVWATLIARPVSR